MARGPESTTQERAAFASALETEMLRRKITNQALAGILSESTGRNVDTATASNYRNGKHEPPRRGVFALEALFDLRPGALSRLLGYLPVEAVDALPFEAALDADPQLTADARKALMAVYQSYVGSTDGR